MKKPTIILLMACLWGARFAAAGPAAPTKLTMTVSALGMVVDWTASTTTGVTYNVYRSTAGTGDTSPAPLISGLGTTRFIDNTDFAGLSYFYSVVAVDQSANTSDALAMPVRMPGDPASKAGYPKATGNSGEVKLDWLNGSTPGVNNFAVFTSLNPAGPNISTRVDVATTSATKNSADCQLEYYWAAPIVGSAGYSQPVLLGSAAPFVEPDAPTITAIAAIPNSDKVALSFTAATGGCSIAGYYICVNSAQSPRYFVDGSAATSYYFEFSAPCGQSQTVWVQVVDDFGNQGPLSAPSSTSVPCPPDLVAVVVGGNVNLKWTQPSPTATPVSYTIYRADGTSGTFNKVADHVLLQAYHDSTPVPFVSYRYKINQVDSLGGISVDSNVVSILGPPTGLAATPSNGKVSLAWSAPVGSSGATGYVVYSATCQTCSLTAEAQTTALSVTLTGKANGTPLWFGVASEGGGLTGETCTPVAATPALFGPTVTYANAALGPNLNVAGTSALTLSWTDGAKLDIPLNKSDKFNVYRADVSCLTCLVLVDTTAKNQTTDHGFYSCVTCTTLVYSIVPVDSLNNTLTPPGVVTINRPAPPTNLASASGDNRVLLSWSGTADAIGYKIYRATEPTGICVSPGNLNTPNLFVLDTDISLASNMAISYTATSLGPPPSGVGGTIESLTCTTSILVSTTVFPGAPGGLTSSSTVWLGPAAGLHTVNLRWDPAPLGSNPISEYLVYRGPSSPPADLLAAVPASVNGTQSCVDLCAGTFYYQVFGVDTMGNQGPGSLVYSATFSPPGPPTTPASVSTTGGTVALSWTPPVASPYAASQFVIYRSNTPGAGTAGDLAAVTAARSFTETAQGYTTYYDIFTVDLAGNTGTSYLQIKADLVGELGTGMPSSPTALVLAKNQPSPGQVTLKWALNPSKQGVYQYKVYQNNSATPLTTVTGTNYFVDPTAYNFGAQSVTYTVQAVNAFGQSVQSTAANLYLMTPPAPAVTVSVGPNASDNSATRLTLNWNDVGFGTNTTGYHVFRAASPGQGLNGTCLATVTFTSLVDTVPDTTTVFFYTVYSAFNNVISDPSKEASGQAILVPKGPFVVAKPLVNSVEIDWIPNTLAGQALEYAIYLSNTAAIDPTQPYLAHSFGRSYISALTAGSTAYYEVVALNNAGGQGITPVSPVYSSPSAATGLTAAPGWDGSQNTVLLTWNAVPEATSYDVLRNGTNIGFGLTLPTFVDVNPAVNTAFTYAVISKNVISGPSSNTVTVKVYLPAPAPAGASALPINGGLQISWQPVDPSYGVQSYGIYDSGNNLVLSTTGTYCVVSPLANSVPYSFDIAGINTAGKGLTSNVSGEPLVMAPPSPPLNLVAQSAFASQTMVELSWQTPTAAVSYNLYRSLSPITGLGGVGGSANPNFAQNIGFALTFTASSTSSFADLSIPTGSLDQVVYYALTCVDRLGRESSPGLASVIPYQSPGAVTGLVVNSGLGRIDLQWGAPVQQGTDSLASFPYRVYRYGVTYTATVDLALAETGGILLAQTKVTQFTDLNPFPGNNYYFVVCVDGMGRESSVNASHTAVQAGSIPQPPALFTALPGNHDVTLVWQIPDYTAPANGARYTVFRGESLDSMTAILTNQGPISANGNLAAFTTSLDDHSAVNLHTYYYAMSQVNNSGEGPKTQIVEVTPFLPLAGALGQDVVTATLVNKSQIQLKWPEISPPNLGESYPLDYYGVFKSQDAGSSYQLISKVASAGATLSCVDTQTNFGNFYVYRVVPVDTGGHEGSSYQVARIQVPPATNDLILDHNAINPEKGIKLGIRYSLIKAGKVWIKVFTLSGDYVATVVDTDIPGVSNSNPYVSDKLYWDGHTASGRTAASGVYLVHMEGPGVRFDAKVAVIK